MTVKIRNTVMLIAFVSTIVLVTVTCKNRIGMWAVVILWLLYLYCHHTGIDDEDKEDQKH